MIFSTINIVLASHSMFLSFILFKRKANTISNRMLGTFFLLLALSFGMSYFVFNTSTINSLIFIKFSMLTLFLGLPLFYLYGKTLLKIPIDKRTVIINFLPFLLLLFYLVYSKKTNLSTPIIRMGGQYYSTPIKLDSFLIIEAATLFCLYYMIRLLYFLHTHQIKIENYFSTTESLNSRWLRIHVTLGLLSSAFFLITNILDLIIIDLNGTVFFVIELSGAAASILFTFTIAYYSYNQKDIASSIDEMNQELEKSENRYLNEIADAPPQYKKQRLDLLTEKRYLKKILDHMKLHKPYLDSDLTLIQLAEELSIPSHHLTMILNLHLKQNYYTFINRYRVEEVCERMKMIEYTKENILTIAFEVGFNSKTTFNTTFKRIIGKTPREYRESLQRIE